MSPVVSIIMPTFNRAHYLKETLKSIVNQSFHSWECLIIDDGSTDHTKEVLKPYLNADQRIKFIERTVSHLKGPAGCRNQGIELAKGSYVVFFDSDDIVHPDLLKISMNSIRSNPNLQFCNYEKKPFSGLWSDNFETLDNYKPNYNRLIEFKNLEDIVTQKIGFACCTVLWDKKVFGNDRFNEELTYAEEWEFYIRLFSKEIKGSAINKILYFNRKHPDSNTGQFWNNNPARRASKVKAVELVIDHLKANTCLSRNMVKHFIQLGFLLKEKAIINKVLKATDADLWKRMKYNGGYLFYPFFKQFFIFKSKLKSS
ncbi:glycosyltransferase family 2 protein [Salinimicrobium sp. HB62]|uniref:glycosyltransferase family 2 protein n=1 Tax=Salinimicrobium sp. HB62 TaxID=3077781 RepID=UPI002D766C9E|nr:glycosyltransferase family 2 protein [Salinimicrobium sp. HB62]